MREHALDGGAAQIRGKPLIDEIGDRLRCATAVTERGDNLLFAPAPMVEVVLFMLEGRTL